MVKALIGKKMGMTSMYGPEGYRFPVTLIEVGPCMITQVKNADGPDGYSSVQLGFQPVKLQKLNKPLQGHFKKAGLKDGYKVLREVRVDDTTDLEVGNLVTADQIFDEHGIVKITGTSIGRGFAGAMKRHGFHGAPASHGASKVHRRPMSAGSTDAARVFKGKRSPGHMGNARVTIKGLEILRIKPLDSAAPNKPAPETDGGEGEKKDKKNAATGATKFIVAVKGAIPGKPNSIVMIEQNA